MKEKSRITKICEYIEREGGPATTVKLSEALHLTKTQVRAAASEYYGKVVRVDFNEYDTVDHVMQNKRFLYVPTKAEIDKKKLLYITDLEDYLHGWLGRNEDKLIQVFEDAIVKKVIPWKFEYKKRFGVKRLHCISVNKLKLDLGQGLLFLYIDWKGGIVHYRKVNSTEVSNIMSSDYVCFLQRQLLRLLKYNSNHLEAAMFLTLRYFGLKHNSPTALPNIYTLAKLIPEVTTSVEVKVKDYSNESYFDDVLDLTVFLKKYLYKDGKGDYNPVRIADIHGIKVGMRANAPEYLKWNGSVWESLGVDVDLFDAEVPKEFFCAE